MPVNDQTPDVVLYDSNGVELSVSNGVATPVGTRGLHVAGTDGANTRFLLTDTSGRLYVITSNVEQATWVVNAGSVVPGNNKSMLSILNATDTAVVVRLREIWLGNVQTTPIVGVVGVFELRRMTGHSGGASVTAHPHDTADTLDTNVTARTGATITGEGPVMMSHRWSTDEWGPGTLDEEGYAHGIQASQPFWVRKDFTEKPLTLRSDQGFTLKFATNSAVGSFDIRFVFTAAAT